jgi:hypothetical protein
VMHFVLLNTTFREFKSPGMWNRFLATISLTIVVFVTELGRGLSFLILGKKSLLKLLIWEGKKLVQV